ncbi:MAG TPA: hypothetical protein VJJ24_02670 [Candidatus Paceibacterota bacterium]
MKISGGKLVSVPSESIKKMLEAAEQFTNAQDAIEDYLFMSQENIVRVLRSSRKEQLAGKTRDISILTRRYGISD